MSIKKVCVRHTARKKPMLQSWTLQSEEEDSGSEEESTSENDVRSRLQFSGKRIVS